MNTSRASIGGATGAQGFQGVQGTQGFIGDIGAQGKQGLQGHQGVGLAGGYFEWDDTLQKLTFKEYGWSSGQKFFILETYRSGSY